MKSLTELHPQIIIFSISRSLNGAFSQTKSKLLLLEIKLLWIKSNKSLSVLSPSKKCSIQRLQQRKGIICFLFSLRTSLPEIDQNTEEVTESPKTPDVVDGALRGRSGADRGGQTLIDFRHSSGLF